jgi:hypothetical protein
MRYLQAIDVVSISLCTLFLIALRNILYGIVVLKWHRKFIYRSTGASAGFDAVAWRTQWQDDVTATCAAAGSPSKGGRLVPAAAWCARRSCFCRVSAARPPFAVLAAHMES